MAVGTQQPQVLQPVVQSVAVDVVKGERQANGLVAAFRGRPIDRILSSPAVRCVQTVEPLARDRGLPVEMVPWLFEGTDGSTLLETIRSLPGPAVLCTHGDAIPKIYASAGLPPRRPAF